MCYIFCFIVIEKVIRTGFESVFSPYNMSGFYHLQKSLVPENSSNWSEARLGLAGQSPNQELGIRMKSQRLLFLI